MISVDAKTNVKQEWNIWNITLNYCFICKIASGLILSGSAPRYLSNAHNLTPLFYPLGKIVNDTVPMIMSFKVLKYFSNSKISFFLFAIPSK